MQADGQTSLHMAAANGHTDTVNALFVAGANIFASAVRGLVSRVWRPATHAMCRACSVAISLIALSRDVGC
jgi:ankyrin repeat protein